jgi:hypothetical protein
MLVAHLIGEENGGIESGGTPVLAADFPHLWRDPNTPDRERKRMTRLSLDVTMLCADYRQVQPPKQTKNNKSRKR